MEKQVTITKLRCPAMIKAEIADPESYEGMVFCAGGKRVESQCPYPYCVVVEGQSSAKRADRKKLARELHSHRVSVKDISLIMKLGISTVRGYLRR